MCVLNQEQVSRSPRDTYIYYIKLKSRLSVRPHFSSSHVLFCGLCIDSHWTCTKPKLCPLASFSSFLKALGAIVFPRVPKAHPCQLKWPSFSVALNNKIIVNLLQRYLQLHTIAQVNQHSMSNKNNLNWEPVDDTVAELWLFLYWHVCNDWIEWHAHAPPCILKLLG